MTGRLSRLLLLAGGLLLRGSLLASEVPFLAGRVNDLAEILSADTRSELENLLKSHEDSTSNQVVVLTVPNLEGEVLEEYSIRVVETWKLGQKGKDNGVLLLVARDERKVRIEVGRGLEGELTDQTCGMIIRREIVPRFRDGDFNGGVKGGVSAIIDAVRGTYTAEDEGLPATVGAGILAVVFLLTVVPFTFIALLSRGGAAWFLFFFLIPFWGVFPTAFLGPAAGLGLLGTYVVGFLAARLWLRITPSGRRLQRRAAGSRFFSGGFSGGSSRSSGGGFSGGGGSFGGGGSSGSW